MNRKKGNIEIFIFSLAITLFFIILAIIFLLYIQINSCIYSVKTDLFYIAQNAYLAVNNTELAYSNYAVNDEILQEKIITLLLLNYPNYKFNINNIRYDYYTNSVLIDINLKIEPIALKSLIGNINLKIKDRVKLKLMEVR